MHRIRILGGIVAGVFLYATLAAAASQVPTMSIEELKQRLGDNSLLIVDVRSPKDWDNSKVKITKAKRMAPRDTDWILAEPKSRPIVLYCA